MGLFDIFKKNKTQEITEPCGFEFYGGGRHLKSDDEMRNIDVVAADAAFKKYKKEILDVYLKSQGFKPYKTANYARLNSIGVVEYINLQKEAHGSRTFTVNFCLFPLYVPHTFVTIGFGNRIGSYIQHRDFWWSYHDMSTAEKSFTNVVAALDEYVMPWYAERSKEDVYLDELINGKYMLGNSRIEWMLHLFVKNNDIAGAKQFLESIKNDPQYVYIASRIKGDIDKRIAEMRELLESIQDTEQYISDVINQNVEKHKLPAAFKQKNSR